MTRDDFLAYAPRFEDPLVISFIEMTREQGYSSEVSFGFWDFYVWDADDTPQIVVKTVKNSISDALMARLVTEPTPLKVLLMEGAAIQWARLESQKLFLAATGTGVYVRNVGWRSLPGTPLAETVEDLQLKLSPRWRLRDGRWEKTCTSCGEAKGTLDFYPSAYKTARDPYRNICKTCWNPRKEST